MVAILAISAFLGMFIIIIYALCRASGDADNALERIEHNAQSFSGDDRQRKINIGQNVGTAVEKQGEKRSDS